MVGQQLNVDVIANNLANVNTTAYKKERVEFKDLLYENMNAAYNILGGDSSKPVGLNIGHGAYPVATVKSYAQGNFERTENPLDFAIDGPGFFTVKGPNGTPVYTKDGSFKISVTPEGNKIVTSDGYSVLDQAGNEITITGSTKNLIVTSTGELMLSENGGVPISTGQKFGLVQFNNMEGLNSLGSNLCAATSASGEPISEAELTSISSIQQQFIETSNVQVVEEMVKLIMAQRAYEINSKSIQSADEMLGMANNLRRG
jgi:flagellar basal-body rod protein FlgG